MIDVLDWLKAQRDYHADRRDEHFRTDDWSKGNPHDDMARNLYRAIQEIEKSRDIIAVMKDVLMNRIIDGNRP